MKKTAVALGILLSAVSQISLADEAELQQELTQLKQQFAQLQQRLNQVEVKSKTGEDLQAQATDSGVENTDLENDEALSAVATPATSDDIEGLKSELENYKYDQSRQYERQTVKSARDTTLYAVRYSAVACQCAG